MKIKIFNNKGSSHTLRVDSILAIKKIANRFNRWEYVR